MALFRFVSLIIITLCCLQIFAQTRTVAITVDDLPYAGEVKEDSGTLAGQINRRLLKAFQKHQVPVTGFVVEKTVQELGPESGRNILRMWAHDGFDLGNHTYSHSDMNTLSVDQIESDIIRGEATYAELMKEAGRVPKFFRFPMSHTGESKAKHDAIANFLSQRGYTIATCTIDNSDYLFNEAYVLMLERRDNQSARRLRREYLAYTSVEIDYYADLSRQVLGYESPQVMVLHDNRLNADAIGEILTIFEKKKFRFVSLTEAQSDASFQIPDTFITPYGPMWAYRWAKERRIQVNGSLEVEPPSWVTDYLTKR